MNFDEFCFQFKRLTKAFPVIKAEEKGEVYFEELKKLPIANFGSAVSKAINEVDRFPTIAKLRQLTTSVAPSLGRQAEKCNECDGFGTISLWNHTFRARCVHGDKISKQIALQPLHDNERKKWFMNLSHQHQKTYNREFPHDINEKAIF